jgi:ketosteroid isomerase-like protein
MDEGSKEQRNREVVERALRALSEGQLDLFFEQLHEACVEEYPQSGERIAGKERLQAVYRSFPNLPRITVRRIHAAGDLVVVECDTDYGEGAAYQGVFILDVHEGKIAREIAYWMEPFQAPEWRAQWVEQV